MKKYSRKQLGERLVEEGLITPEVYEQALKKHAETKLSVRQILIDDGYISEQELSKFIAKVLRIPFMNNLDITITDSEVLSLVPESFCREHSLIALYKMQNILTVAMADPFDVFAIDDLRTMTKCEINPVLALDEDIRKAIDKCHGKKDVLRDMVQGVTQEVDLEIIKKQEASGQADEQVSLQETAGVDEGPIIRLVNSMVMQAIEDRASDIHIEPEEDALRVRFRIDGVLQETMSPPKHLQAFIISRIKIMAGMDISIKRSPQDGRFGVKGKGNDIDVRISTIPTVHGEKIVMRLLNQSNIRMILDELGFSEHCLKQFRELIRQPYGIILISGPTGSGKTTTLYVALQNINSPDKNIITIEEPVEYQIKGVNQIQVNVKAGVTFANGLRAILRQDPDIIMVGEMRDLETAEISVQAALTGHLVFSTIHTNDAVSSIIRLVDMGVAPYLVAAAVNGVVAQRLVRLLCPKCKTPYKPSSDILEQFGLSAGAIAHTFYQAKGCEQCNNSGFYGRTAMVELMAIDKQIRHMIHTKQTSDSIREAAEKGGMKPLWDDGIAKILTGVTTFEEVRKASFMEDQ